MIRVAAVALTAAAALALSACSDNEPARDEEGNITETGQADVFDIQAGDCLVGLGEGQQISDVDVAPCEQEHGHEAYAITELEDGDFPGEEALNSEGEIDCAAEFEPFVGVPYEESELLITWLQPTEESWGQGDRELVCLLFEQSGSTTGTLRDASR